MEFITTDQRIAVENFYIGKIYTITFKNNTSITRACIGKGADYVMFQETAPKMLFTLNMQTAATVDTIEPGTGSGTYDYDDLENKPQINSVTLSGNKSTSDLGIDEVPAVGVNDDGKVLKASYSGGVGSYSWQSSGGGGGGTSDYSELDNKPQINSVTLSGNLSSADLGLQDAISAEDPISASYISGLATVATTGAYSDLSGLPTLGTAAAAAATDFATAAQGSKADAADTAISTAATGFASLDARLDSMDTTISGKQGALSSTQLDAVNSGIDSTKVQQIATNTTAISGKQDTLTTAQLAAANSGITSAGVAQIETNKTNILSAYGGIVGKNKLNVTLQSATQNGVTYTNNGGNEINVSSESTITSQSSTIISNIEIPLGNYTVKAIANGITLSDSTTFVNVVYENNGVQGNVNVSNEFTFGNAVEIIQVSIYVRSGQNPNGSIKVMICDSDIYSESSDFVPYVMSNLELTAAIQAIQAQLANT